MFEKLILYVVFIVVGITLIVGQGALIHDQSCTHGFNASGRDEAGCALQNISSSAKFMYGLLDFLWAVLPVVLIAAGIMGMYQTAKGLGK